MKLILSFLLSFSISFSQTSSFKTGNWKNYTDVKNINGLSTTGDFIWAATSGGAFSYNKTGKDFKNYTNVEGLSSIEITAIEIDNRNQIWFGNSNGFIDQFNLTTQTWSHISDIYLSTNSLKKSINAFLSVGDSLYIATDFGVSLFSIKQNYFLDTYLKFGKFPSLTPVNTIKIFSGKLWVGTSYGLACADLSNKNILSPDAWTNFTGDNGLLSNMITALEVYNNILYVGTDNGFQKYDNGKFSSAYMPGNVIVKMQSKFGFLYVAADWLVYKINETDQFLKIGESMQFQISTLNIDDSGVAWIGLQNKGLYFYNGTKWENIKLNCPNSNKFINLAVDKKGTLWAASGNINGAGFYSLKNNIWTNYAVENYPEIRMNNYYRVIVDQDNSKWIGSWGRGIAVIEDDTTIKILNENNSKLTGIPDDPTWVTISGLALDNKGNIWVLNYQALNGAGLVKIGDSSQAYKIENSNIVVNWDIVIDDYGTKWINSKDPALTALCYFNEKYTLENTTNGWGYLSMEDIYPGASSVSINCLAIDKNNELWLGTDKGIAVISDTRSPRSSTPLRPCYTTQCDISGQIINCITVDALNNKWVGTQSSGVWVLNPDGSNTLIQYNLQTSKIPDNNVKSIAIDNSTGTVYIGTEKGLSSLETVLIEPLPEFSKKLKISPNPFIPNGNYVLIDGLVENSLLKIITPSGKLIKQITSPGGRIAYWDGKDSNDQFVSTGVYFIVAYSNDGSQIALGKVAIIRK